MSDNVEVVEAVAETVETKSYDNDYVVALEKEAETLKAFKAQVLEEKHTEKKKRQDIEAKLAKEQAEKEGDIQKLLALKDSEYQAMLQERDQKLSAYENEKRETTISGAAMRIASELSSNVKKAETLANILRTRLQLTEDGVKVTDGKGNFISDKFDVLKDYAKKEYDFLCDGLQSTGGAGVKIATPTGTMQQNITPLQRLMNANNE